MVATTGIILGAAYMLYLYWRVAYGKLTKDDVAAMPDLNLRELAMLWPDRPRGACGWVSIPKASSAPMRKDVGVLIARVERAKPAGDTQLKLAAARSAGQAEAATGEHE